MSHISYFNFDTMVYSYKGRNKHEIKIIDGEVFVVTEWIANNEEVQEQRHKVPDDVQREYYDWLAEKELLRGE